MSDLISRQAAIDALDVLCQEHRYRIPGKRETYSEYNEAWQDALDRAEGAIGNLPSAQPKRGKWIERGTWSEGYGMGETYGKYWACNQCGREVKGFWGECGKNFCDNCGADMRGNEDGTDL